LGKITNKLAISWKNHARILFQLKFASTAECDRNNSNISEKKM